MALHKFQVSITEMGVGPLCPPRFIMANTAEEALWMVEEWLYAEGFDLAVMETEARRCKR